MNIEQLFLTKTEKEISRIKEIVETIAKLRAEYEELVGDAGEPPPRRPGRPPKTNGQSELPMK